MANTSPKVLTETFTLRAERAFFSELDELRRLSEPVPTKSEAIRTAVRAELARARALRARRRVKV